MRAKAQKLIVSVKCPKCKNQGLPPQLADVYDHGGEKNVWHDVSTNQIIGDVNCPTCGGIIETILYSF